MLDCGATLSRSAEWHSRCRRRQAQALNGEGGPGLVRVGNFAVGSRRSTVCGAVRSLKRMAHAAAVFWCGSPKTPLRAATRSPGLHRRDVAVSCREWISGSREGAGVPNLAGRRLDRLECLQMVSDPFEDPNQIDIALPIGVPTAVEAEDRCDYRINRCDEAFRVSVRSVPLDAKQSVSSGVHFFKWTLVECV